MKKGQTTQWDGTHQPFRWDGRHQPKRPERKPQPKTWTLCTVLALEMNSLHRHRPYMVARHPSKNMDVIRVLRRTLIRKNTMKSNQQ